MYLFTGTSDNLPAEDLGVKGSTVEEQVNSLTEIIFPENGFKVERWSRVPYLCEGDLDQTFYWLHDFLFILSKIDSDYKYNESSKHNHPHNVSDDVRIEL